MKGSSNVLVFFSNCYRLKFSFQINLLLLQLRWCKARKACKIAVLEIEMVPAVKFSIQPFATVSAHQNTVPADSASIIASINIMRSATIEAFSNCRWAIHRQSFIKDKILTMKFSIRKFFKIFMYATVQMVNLRGIGILSYIC